jgi:hypothetical protein
MRIPLSDKTGAFERALERHQDRQFDEHMSEQSVTVDWSENCKACDCECDTCTACIDYGDEDETP